MCFEYLFFKLTKTSQNYTTIIDIRELGVYKGLVILFELFDFH